MGKELLHRCRYTPVSTFARGASLLFYPVIGLIAGSVGIYLLLECFSGKETSCHIKIVPLFIALCALGCSIFMFFLSVSCYRMENRRFAVHAAGITVRDRKEVFYTWGDLYEIAIVAYGASASGQFYQTVICLLLEPPEHRFLKKIRSSYVYGAINTERFVLIDYSPQIVQQIRARYPQDIHDYRDAQLKKIV